jgi:hypothetical protein
MVGSAIALSISVGQFSDKPGQIHFRISRLESAFQRGLEPVYEGHQIANQIWIQGGCDVRKQNSASFHTLKV